MISNVKVPEFKFQKKQEEVKLPEKKVIQINVKYIVLGVLAVMLLIGVVFGIYHLADNFYLIKYKIESRRIMKRSFKEIKIKKHRHRK